MRDENKQRFWNMDEDHEKKQVHEPIKTRKEGRRSLQFDNPVGVRDTVSAAGCGREDHRSLGIGTCNNRVGEKQREQQFIF